MTGANSLFAALVIGVMLSATVACRLQTRCNPVVLNVVKKTKNDQSKANTDLPGRTSPVLIQQLMGLQPGAPFEFNIQKWRAISTSGLFHNITVQAVESKLGAYLNITGYEAPSIAVAPEITVSASLDSPEVHGGLSWTDTNFRGMGDTLELSFLKKEGLQDDLLALDPTVTMRWKECSIGKCSRVSVKHEEDNAFSELGNSLSQSVQAMLCAITGDSGVLTSRLPVRYTTTSAQFVSSPPIVGHKPVLGLKLRSVQYGLEPFIRRQACGVAWQRDEPNAAGQPIHVQTTALGAKMFAESQLQGGALARLAYESGNLIGNAKRALCEPFHQISASLQPPPVVLRKGTAVSTSAMTRDKGAAGILRSAAAKVSATLAGVDCVGRMRLQGMTSWGAGCTASQQVASGSHAQYVRCLPAVQRAAALGSAQLDVYIKNLLPYDGVVGAFLDAGVAVPAVHAMSDPAHDSSYKGLATGGLSLRVMGFRVDYGAQLGGKLNPQVRFGFELGD